MPCSDPGADAYENKQLRERLNKVTRYLCTVCNYLEKRYGCVPSHDVQAWWDQHKKDDQKRLAKEAESLRIEQLKQRAKSKLTKEEREALNIRE